MSLLVSVAMNSPAILNDSTNAGPSKRLHGVSNPLKTQVFYPSFPDNCLRARDTARLERADRAAATAPLLLHRKSRRRRPARALHATAAELEQGRRQLLQGRAWLPDCRRQSASAPCRCRSTRDAAVRAQIRIEAIAHDGEQPTLEVGAGLELVLLVECRQDGVLHEIGQRPRDRGTRSARRPRRSGSNATMSSLIIERESPRRSDASFVRSLCGQSPAATQRKSVRRPGGNRTGTAALSRHRAKRPNPPSRGERNELGSPSRQLEAAHRQGQGASGASSPRTTSRSSTASRTSSSAASRSVTASPRTRRSARSIAGSTGCSDPQVAVHREPCAASCVGTAEITGG